MNRLTVIFLGFLLLLMAASCAAPKASETPPTTIPAYIDPCAAARPLQFPVDQAAASLFGVAESGESPARLVELGADAAQELADGLQPTGSVCDLAVSAETQAVIDEARRLAGEGKSAEALRLLEQRLEQFETLTRSGHLAKAVHTEGDWRNKIRDILAMGAAAYDLGGNPQPFHSAANAIFRSNAGRELADADLLGSMRIEGEAELFGEAELAEQAEQRVNQIASEMIDAAIEDFDPCSADRGAVVDLLNTAARAWMIGVEDLEPGEPRYEAVKSKSQQALAHQWNAYVRQNGLSETLLEPAPPCAAAGELEVRIFSVCSQSWSSAGTIQFKTAEDGEVGELCGQGHLAFSEQTVIGGELDCSVTIDADVLLTGKFLEEAGVRRVEFSPSFSSDGHYLVAGRTTPIHDEGVYPLNGYGAFVMPWVDGSAHPSSGEHIIRYVLHITSE
jgi:hypothetical protein